MNGADVHDRGESCRWFQHHLGEFASGAMDPIDRQAAEDHLLECSTCLEAWADWIGDPPDLTDGLFSRMGIDPCARAAQLLGADNDDRFDLDNDLLSRHLEVCRSCETVADAVRQLASDLPELRDVDPDQGFFGDVVAATVAPLGAASPWLRIRDFCVELAQRPRIAIEVAYAVSVLALVVVGFDGQVFAGVRRAQQSPSAVANTVFDVNSRMNRQAQLVGRGFYGAIGSSLQSTSAGYQNAIMRASNLDLKIPAIRELIGSDRTDNHSVSSDVYHEATESTENQGGSE